MMPTVADLIAQMPLAVLWLGYFVLHSALASHRMKHRIGHLGPRWTAVYRLLYNGIALLTLLPLLWWLYQKPGPMLWQWHGLSAWLASALALAAVAGFVVTWRQYDGDEFLGWRQWRERMREADGREEFCISTFHRHVRHPWYCFGLVILWTRDMNLALLVSALLMTAYLIVGAHLEEQKLLRRHGEAYRRYMARVPGLMPWPGRSLSQAEADDLIRLAADRRSDPSSADSTPKSR